MEAAELERLIRQCLSNFYSRRIKALDGLDLKKILQRKNPYLFRANGIANAPEMINELLQAHITSSDENLFGEEFFEPICKALAAASHIAAAPGVDFVIEAEDSYEAVAMKSGPNALNASATRKQSQEFEEMRRSLNATLRRVRKAFIPVMGCGYGRADSPPTQSRKYRKLAGQAFWEHVTGESDFYLKLVRLMRDDPDRNRPVYTQSRDRAVNRFVKQFSQAFCDDSGNILWENLVEFNSGKKRKRPVFSRANVVQ